MNHDAEVRALATLKRFLIDLEIPVRELAELAFANWIAARSFCADERDRSEWALIADLILKTCEKNSGVLDRRKRVRCIVSVAMNLSPCMMFRHWKSNTGNISKHFTARC